MARTSVPAVAPVVAVASGSPAVSSSSRPGAPVAVAAMTAASAARTAGRRPAPRGGLPLGSTGELDVLEDPGRRLTHRDRVGVVVRQLLDSLHHAQEGLHL